MKIITYIQIAKDLQVLVQRRTDLDKCDICKNNQASFIVSYTPREITSAIPNNCIPTTTLVCTCFMNSTQGCPLHPTGTTSGTVFKTSYI